MLTKVFKERRKGFLLLCLPRLRTFVPTYPLRVLRDQGNCSSSDKSFWICWCFYGWQPFIKKFRKKSQAAKEKFDWWNVLLKELFQVVLLNKRYLNTSLLFLKMFEMFRCFVIWLRKILILKGKKRKTKRKGSQSYLLSCNDGLKVSIKGILPNIIIHRYQS